MDYEQDIKIDGDLLDVECLEQPRLMLRYTKLEAQLEKEEDLAKENLNFVQAELDKAVRADPEKYGIEKLTEAGVKATILSQPDYKEANAKYIDAKFESKVATGAVKAFEQRKSMLETLARLHGQQYFAGPKVPHDLSAEKEKRQERITASIGGTLKPRQRNG